MEPAPLILFIIVPLPSAVAQAMATPPLVPVRRPVPKLPTVIASAPLEIAGAAMAQLAPMASGLAIFLIAMEAIRLKARFRDNALPKPKAQALQVDTLGTAEARAKARALLTPVLAVLPLALFIRIPPLMAGRLFPTPVAIPAPLMEISAVHRLSVPVKAVFGIVIMQQLQLRLANAVKHPLLAVVVDIPVAALVATPPVPARV